MKFFWCPMTRAARVMWMLEESGVDYERVLIDIRDTNTKERPDFKAASPMGKVPAIEDGEVAIADSAAICLYLADKYAPGRLAPAIDDPHRGAYLYWMTFTPGVIEPSMAEKFGGWETNRQSHGWGDFDTMIKTLETALDGKDWLLGDWFTAADVLVGSTCNFLKMFGIMPESKILLDYIDRCLARPAYARTLAVESAFAPRSNEE